MNIKKLIPRYADCLRTMGRADRTIDNITYYLRWFTVYLDGLLIYEIEQLDSDILANYQEELSWRVGKKGTLIKKETQCQALGTVKGFCCWLADSDYLASDPARCIRLPRKPQRLPGNVMEVREINRLIKKADIHTLEGYRNRLVLELLYTTGIRRAECSNIKIDDIDHENGYLRINAGKGGKDRVVPVGKTACDLCRNYIIAIRPEFLDRRDDSRDDGYLILNRWGRKMHPMGIYMIVKKYVKLSNQKKNVSPHTIRRSCTTHMLKKGAGIRHLQEMLGHSNINSTIVYTKLTINDLKKAHAKYHPREKDRE